MEGAPPPLPDNYLGLVIGPPALLWLVWDYLPYWSGPFVVVFAISWVTELLMPFAKDEDSAMTAAIVVIGALGVVWVVTRNLLLSGA